MADIFMSRAREIISNIPEGKVSTYGIIARHAGNKSGARQVARILHSSSDKYDLPWHRVVNRLGKISLPQGNGYELQRELLEEEGVSFDEYNKIDFATFLWIPGKNHHTSSYESL
ncbi:MGMT family protein [Desulfosediminicola flagellatus]|uniref:MGMT family protein n=1 Tax=Desulfosediminicola flagellatus TaxID=2569541 RepID=UPI0010AC4BE5|nr:MGMT family protein [Desulfosediminicola flagellatus]